MRLYDAQHNRLVQYGHSPTPQFWASIWQEKRPLKQALHTNTGDPLIPHLTRRFIPPGRNKRILDGGCGSGQHVARLQREGYTAYGIDYDQYTIDHIKKTAPGLNMMHGDVRALPYLDNFFDGYWSIGVIEHWPQGYMACAQEMYRVLKNRGYLFLTFPHMSWLRTTKAKRGYYPTATMANNNQPFYQYMLDHTQVQADFERLGFSLVYQTRTGGLKGLKDETPALQSVLQRLYDSPCLINKIMKVSLSWALNPIASHSAVLVFRKGHP